MKRRDCQRGFTLIEILVVLVLIAVVVGLIVINIDAGPLRQQSTEALRLKTTLEQAASEALIYGWNLGVVVDDEGFQVLVYDSDNRQWLGMEGRVYQHQWTIPLTVEVHLDGDREDMLLVAEQSDNVNPQLLFLASGESAPFQIELRSPKLDQGALLLSDGISGVWLQ